MERTRRAALKPHLARPRRHGHYGPDGADRLAGQDRPARGRPPPRGALHRSNGPPVVHNSVKPRPLLEGEIGGGGPPSSRLARRLQSTGVPVATRESWNERA